MLQWEILCVDLHNTRMHRGSRLNICVAKHNEPTWYCCVLEITEGRKMAITFDVCWRPMALALPMFEANVVKKYPHRWDGTDM